MLVQKNIQFIFILNVIKWIEWKLKKFEFEFKINSFK